MAPMDFDEQRDAMVQQQLAARGVRSPRVLQAMRRVPREHFVDDALRDDAYRDGPLPIGAQQTISQPYVVALMAEALALQGDERVLEIGTGSGYAAAVLGCLAARVVTVERIESLAQQAARRLAALGYDNVQVRCGDGTLGWPDEAPYGGIVVTAAGPSLPPALKEQLADGAWLVMPVGADAHAQELLCVQRTGRRRYRSRSLGGVRFVPLRGAQGWPD